MTTENLAPLQTTLAAARAKLAEASAERRDALESLASVARAWTRGEAMSHELTAAIVRLGDATKERDEWQSVVDETLRPAAIERETSDPTVAPTAVRARVEALIARHVFGHEIVRLPGETARPWRIRTAGGIGPDYRPVPHYASDPVSCAEAIDAVGRDNVASVLVALIITGGKASATIIAREVLGASCFTRAVCVLKVIDIDVNADPCA